MLSHEATYLQEFITVEIFVLLYSCVLQLLFNQGIFREVLEDVKQSHSPECEKCNHGK